MKKIYLIAMSMFLLGASASAQDKEAIKAADKLVKEATKQYTMSIPNQQYGRKETNFERLDGAKNLVNQAIVNELCKSNPQTWKTAADIYLEYFKKYEEAAKLEESARPQYIDAASKVVEYSIKYDSLVNIDPKKKEAEKKFVNETYRNQATNPLLQCLQAAQEYSNSDEQAQLKLGNKYATLVSYAFEESHLFSTIKNSPSIKADALEGWKTYAKAFRAQSLQAIEGTSPAEVEAAWKQLYGTQYESAAYSSLINYFRDKDQAKYTQIMKEAYQNAKGENAAQFGFMYMQTLFSSEKKDECVKVIDDLIAKYPGNDNILNAYLMKGQVYFEKKDFETAEKIFAEAASKFPDEERAVTMPAKCAWMKAQNSGKKEDREYTIKLFKDLEAKYPDNPDIWGEPLYILYNNNNQPQLRDKYKKYYNVK